MTIVNFSIQRGMEPKLRNCLYNVLYFYLQATPFRCSPVSKTPSCSININNIAHAIRRDNSAKKRRLQKQPQQNFIQKVWPFAAKTRCNEYQSLLSAVRRLGYQRLNTMQYFFNIQAVPSCWTHKLAVSRGTSYHPARNTSFQGDVSSGNRLHWSKDDSGML